MQQLSNLLFVSSNVHKYHESKKILDSFGINAEFFKCDLEEIQSDSFLDIASKKAKDAFSICKKPLIIEDDGLLIDSLNGFPGPYSSYIFRTIGNKGILDLVTKNRQAKFISVITYCDKKKLKSFYAKLDGTISKIQKGSDWGYDPIFIPKNSTKTFAESLNKNKLSHRYKALKKFSKWYLDKKE